MTSDTIKRTCCISNLIFLWADEFWLHWIFTLIRNVMINGCVLPEGELNHRNFTSPSLIFPYSFPWKLGKQFNKTTPSITSLKWWITSDCKKPNITNFTLLNKTLQQQNFSSCKISAYRLWKWICLLGSNLSLVYIYILPYYP